MVVSRCLLSQPNLHVGVVAPTLHGFFAYWRSGEKRKLCLFMPGSLCGHALDIRKQRYSCNNGRHLQRKSTSSFRLQGTPSFVLVSVVVFHMPSCYLFPTWCSSQAYGRAAPSV